MRIDISITGIYAAHADLRRQADSRAWFTLGRFSSLIRQVVIEIQDAGSTGSFCCVNVRMKGAETPIVVDAVTKDPFDALVVCVERCRRTIERRLHLTAIERGRPLTMGAH